MEFAANRNSMLSQPKPQPYQTGAQSTGPGSPPVTRSLARALNYREAV